MAVGRFLLDGGHVALDGLLDLPDPRIYDRQEVVDLGGLLHRLEDLQGAEVAVLSDVCHGGVVVVVRCEHRDRGVVVHVLECHHSAGVGAVHHRGVDRVLDHALAV